jgi:ectoine hydroxylase-related dioxygenase (phytanoyl-CoA dioxygenase family)
MSTPTLADIDSQIRPVTDEEVEAYQEQGWVTMRGLVEPGLAGRFLTELKQVTGLDYDELPRDHPDADAVAERIRRDGVHKVFTMTRMQNQTVWDIVTSRGLGLASARLSGHRSMRIMTDGVICKMPAWTATENLLEGPANNVYTAETPWHQDYCSMPWDRGGGVQFWFALAEVTPEMGSIQYLTGSHREPPLGAVHYTKAGGGQSIPGLYPELWDKYELSEPQHLHPGDVIAHNALAVHAAEPNTTDRLRWVHTSYRMPAETLYSGVPFARFIEYGIELKQWEPFDHPTFPVVAD